MSSAKCRSTRWRDIVPVTLLGSFSQMMVCNPAVPAKTLGELLQLAKREPLTYASGGPGVPGHLAAELLLAGAGVSMLHVPYKGPAAATTDVMGGQVHCGFLATPTVLPHVKAGKAQGARRVDAQTRSPLAPGRASRRGGGRARVRCAVLPRALRLRPRAGRRSSRA